MAAEDKVEVVDDKKLKKEKKSKDKSEKKEKKRSESDGIRKEKKDKKKEKARQEKLARALDAHLQADAAKSFETQEEPDDVDPEDIIKPADELVPFALPLADEKTHKKIYKLIKKGTSAPEQSFLYLLPLLALLDALRGKWVPENKADPNASQQAPNSSRSTAA